MCDICGMKYAHKSALSLHKSLKHGIKGKKRERTRAPDGVKVQCKFCDKAYRFKADLKKHMRKFHLDKVTSNPLPCHMCDEVFIKQVM